MESGGTVVLCGTCRQQLPPGASSCPRCGSRSAAPQPPLAADKRSLRKGEVLEGNWRLMDKLGAGGMATVFLAHDIALDREVAVKILARELCSDAEFVERFEREAQATARLEHPNIVPVYAVGRHAGRPFMVMKRLDGNTLSSLLRNVHRFEPSLALDLFRQICAGLAHVHASGCVHRDLKAGNIFIGPDGHATILDFGVLRDLNSRGMTRVGTLLGTPRYMSPEQARGALDVDHRADLYALGVLLFECLAGCPPFDAHSDLGVINQHASAEPPDITAIEPSLPPALGQMLRRALAKSREERFQSAGELLSAFEAAVSTTAEGRATSLEQVAAQSVRAPVVVEVAPEAPLEETPAAGPTTTRPRLADPHALLAELAAREAQAEAASDPTSQAVEPQPTAAGSTRRWLWPAVAALGVALAGGELLWVKVLRPASPAAQDSSALVAAGADASEENPPVAVTQTPPADAAQPEAIVRESAAVAPKPAAPVAPAAGFGTLKVEAVLSEKPYAATVEIDGEESGDTPASVKLTAGEHRVRVLRTGFQTTDQVVMIKARQTTTVQVDLIP